MSAPDPGQRAARQLYATVTAGDPESRPLDDEVALRLAAACDTLVADLEAARTGGHRLTTATTTGTGGFPDLPTGYALAAGFTGKAGKYLDTLTALQEAALWFKAAYLAAAGRFTEADLADRAARAMAADANATDDRRESDDHG